MDQPPAGGSTLSFTKLMSIAASFIFPDMNDNHAERSDFVAHAKVTYLAESGEEITVSPNEELEDGYDQCVSNSMAELGKMKHFRITITTAGIS